MHSGGNRIDSEKVNDWLQIVGMFGIMASLIFVGVQVRQTQVIGEGESAIQFFEASKLEDNYSSTTSTFGSRVVRVRK